MIRAAVFFILIMLTAVGCVSTDLPPISDAGFNPEHDEKRIWLRAWKETEDIDQSGALYEAPALEAYLNSVARRLQPASVYEVIPFTIRVINSPFLNAFAFPNGVIYIHTGLLSVIENEAEFAILIAHEMTHATHRHALREFRRAKNEKAIAAALKTVVGWNRLDLRAMASISGYSQEMEAEADANGLDLVVKAGYDPHQAVNFFKHLKNEIVEELIQEPYFYGTHPRIQERIDNFSGLLRNKYADVIGGIVNADDFFRQTAGLVLDNAVLDIEAGRFDRAMRSINRYLTRCIPGEARPWYILGEAYRKRNAMGDLNRAREAYGKAIFLDSSFAEAYRGLGLVQFRLSDRDNARLSLMKYLSLNPAAKDREHIERYVMMSMEKSGR